MVNLSLSSWLNSANNTSNEVERKKQNRRSLTGFSPSMPFRAKSCGTATASGRAPTTSDKARNVTGKAPLPLASASDRTTGSEVKVPSATSNMVTLSETIHRETEKLDEYMRQHGLSMPAFDVDAPADFPQLPGDIQKSRLAIIHATKELRDLTVGPRESVRWGVQDFLDVLALQMINNYGIAKLVPLDKPMPLTELQTLTTLDPVNLARILRTAMTNHIFCEPSPGVVAHTAASRLLATDSELVAWVGFNSEDIFPSAAHVLPALRTYPEATSLSRTGFQFAFDTVDAEPMFVTFGKDPERAHRMGRAMVSLTGGEGYEPAFFVDSYDFSDIDGLGGTFVDVGGSHGFMCVSLARKWRNMWFVVQDLPRTVDSAPSPVCEDNQVAGRVDFMAHDFFTEQVMKDADVYYFRWIMHNYSTPYAVDILRNLIPALKPGARIIINDHCLLEPGQENPWDEKIMRRMDMVMLTLLNAQERTEADFREVFRMAGEGFVFKGVMRPQGCRMSIIEAVWKPDEAETLPVVSKTENEAGEGGETEI